MTAPLPTVVAPRLTRGLATDSPLRTTVGRRVRFLGEPVDASFLLTHLLLSLVCCRLPWGTK